MEESIQQIDMSLTAPLDVVLSETNKQTPWEQFASPDPNSFLLNPPPLKWGILGTGRICNDFTQALKLLPTAEVVAVASRSSKEGAERFGKKHGISRCYGTYEELCSDADVDIVYVGNVHLFRLPICTLVLNSNKHCLLEKPMALSKKDAKDMINMAKGKGLFLGEGMWTRYFPAVEMVRELISNGEIGEVTNVASDFHFHSPDQEVYPSSPLYSRKLAGGAAMYLASYPISAALCCFGQWPDKVVCNGIVDYDTEVDVEGGIIMRFPQFIGGGEVGMEEEGKEGNDNAIEAAAPTQTQTTQPSKDNILKPKGGGMACLHFGFLGESQEETTIVGTAGRIVIKGPCNCPTDISVMRKTPGSSRGSVETSDFHFPLPTLTDEINESGGFYYPNSAGLAYEAAAVMRCVDRGETETPQYTMEEAMKVMEIIDEYKEQIGLPGC